MDTTKHVIFLLCGRKAGKGLKKSQKTGKNTENVAGNREMPFWSHRKLKKKSAESWKKHIFSAESRKQTPYSQPSNMQSIIKKSGVSSIDY